jgi:hypothetical protein
MILGLPWTSWLLLFVSVGLGLGISLAFYLSHRGEILREEIGAGRADSEEGPARVDDDGGG